MTMFQKPNVEIAFNPKEPGEEQTVHAPRESLAVTSARRWALAFLLGVICIFTYIQPTYDSDFLPGDDATVKSNPLLFNMTGFRMIWTAPQRLPQLSPVSYTFYMVERLFFAKHPRGYHVISIALHVINVLLLWLLLRRLELPGAWLGAALFAVAPVQVDAVSWISQQRYLICGMFYLSALLVYLRRAGLNPVPPPPAPGAEPLIHLGLPEGQAALYVISILLFILALGSHVLGTTLPLVALILIWWERGAITRADIKPLVPFGILSIAFAILAAAMSHHRTGMLWFTNPGWVGWIVIWGRGVWAYFLATIMPISLSFAHPKWGGDSMRWWHWLLPVAAIFVVGALWQLRRRWGRGPITAALLFLCLLLPSALGAADANDGELAGVMVREHVLYLACAAILVPLATLLTGWLTTSKLTSRLAAMPAFLPIVSILIIAPIAVATGIHTAAYDNTNAVWQNVLSSQGDSVLALNTLGQGEMNEKRYSEAEQHFRRAYAANPNDAQAQMNLARAAEAQKQYDVAIQRYYEILARHPENADAHFGLAEVLATQGDTADALSEYKKVELLDPHNAEVHNNLGLIAAQNGNLDEAIRQYQVAINTDPRAISAYLNMANAQFQQGKAVPDARDTLAKAIAVDPQSYVPWLNAGVMAEVIGDTAAAERYFRNAIACKYDSPDAFNDLGMLLLREGDPPGKTDRLGEAIYCFKRASELDPAKAEYAQNRQAAQEKKDAIIQRQQQ